MENGDSITSGWALLYWCGYNDFPMRQNNTILPHPGDTNKYVIFNYNIEHPLGASGLPIPTILYYHVVDMTRDNGRGAVVQKKQVIVEDTLTRGYLQATRHANGTDWWVVAHEWNSNCYFVIPLTSQGVGAYHRSCAGEVWGNGGGGQVTFSPNGKKYVHCTSLNGLWVFDFDNATGTLSNPLQLTFPVPSSHYRGVCFSPNSRYLYVASYLQLWQFDMEASDIQASLQLVGQIDGSNPIPGGGSLAFSQLGADGKIYIAGPGNHYYLSRINKPNCPGTACDFRQWEISLLAANYAGLPNMPHFNIIESDYDCESVSTDEEQIKKDALRVFPNPFTNVLQVSHDFHQPVRYALFNTIGQTISEGELNKSETFIRVRDDVPPGVYYLSIWSGDGQWSNKIIKTEMR